MKYGDQGLTNGAGFARLYGAFPNAQSTPKLALEISLTRRAIWSAANRVFAMRLGSWRPAIWPMRWLRRYSNSTRRTMKAVIRSVPVSPSCVLITVTRSHRFSTSYDGCLG